MMAEVENLVDDHLRHMRGQLNRLDARVARTEKRGLISSRARGQSR
jgi:hypothetical protein